MGIKIIIGEFNTTLTSMDISSRQKTNKARVILKGKNRKVTLN